MLGGRKLRGVSSSKGLQYCSVGGVCDCWRSVSCYCSQQASVELPVILKGGDLRSALAFIDSHPQERDDSSTPSAFSGSESGSAQNRRNSVLKVATILLARSCKSGYAR